MTDVDLKVAGTGPDAAVLQGSPATAGVLPTEAVRDEMSKGIGFGVAQCLAMRIFRVHWSRHLVVACR